MAQDDAKTDQGPRDSTRDPKQIALLNQRYEIVISQPLPLYNTPTAKAYHVQDLNDPSRALMALICGVIPPPRLHEAKVFNNFTHTESCLLPITYGTVFWPPAEGKQLVFIMNRPEGGAVFDPQKKVLPPCPEDTILNFVARLLPFLQEMNLTKVAHRAICVENLYFTNSSYNTIILGDCLTAPAGYNLPVLYETVQRGLAPREARGTGDISDDLYALGVTALILMTGQIPLTGLNPLALVKLKITEGSYNALTKNIKHISPRLNELLRGLLVDDVASRWGLDALDEWVSGKKRSPKQPMHLPQASRPFRFKDQELLTIQETAHALGTNWGEALKHVTKPDILISWLKRSAEQTEQAEKLAKLVGQVGGGGNIKMADQHRILAQMLVRVHPEGPLYWENSIYMADGHGPAFAMEVMQGKLNHTGSLPLIRERMVPYWINAQANTSVRWMTLNKAYDSAAFHLTNPVIGYGIERALYELNPGLPCLSPLLLSEYVYNTSDLLPALEKVLQKDPNHREILDRHVVAFIASRMEHISQPDLEGLMSADRGTVVISRLKILSLLQSTYKISALPALTRWTMDHINPLIETFANRPYRLKLEERLREASTHGDLGKIFTIATNTTDRKRDVGGFLLAQHEYKNLEEKIAAGERKYLLNQQEVDHNSLGITSTLVMIIGSICLLVIGVYAYLSPVSYLPT